MIKKTITYTNFADEEVTDDFYFHLSKSEIAKMELSGEGNSLSEYLQRIAKAQSGKEIIATMDEIVLASYGVRSVDGREFEKSPEHTRKFKACGAYDVLFLELVTDAKASAEFVRGLAPTDMQEGIPDNFEQMASMPSGVRLPEDRKKKVKKDKTLEVVADPEPVRGG